MMRQYNSNQQTNGRQIKAKATYSLLERDLVFQTPTIFQPKGAQECIRAAALLSNVQCLCQGIILISSRKMKPP